MPKSNMYFGWHRGVSPVKTDGLPTDGLDQPKPHYEQMRLLSDEEAFLSLDVLAELYPYVTHIETEH